MEAHDNFSLYRLNMLVLKGTCLLLYFMVQLEYITAEVGNRENIHNGANLTINDTMMKHIAKSPMSFQVHVLANKSM